MDRVTYSTIVDDYGFETRQFVPYLPIMDDYGNSMLIAYHRYVFTNPHNRIPEWHRPSEMELASSGWGTHSSRALVKQGYFDTKFI